MNTRGVERLRILNRRWTDVTERIGRVNTSAIFVLGNQKSGTSAISSLLAIYGGLSATVDILPEIRRQLIPQVAIGNAPFKKVIKAYRRSFSRDVIKHPNFVLVMDQLLAFFPQSQFLFVVRDPRDNIRSILDRLNLPGDASELTPSQIDPLPIVWKRILGLNDSSSNYLENLCQRWNSVIDDYMRHKDRLGLIRYEDFVKDKAGEIARLAGILGIRQRSTIDELVDKSFQPPGPHRLVSPADFFGHRNLKKIEQLCGPRASHFRYETRDPNIVGLQSQA